MVVDLVPPERVRAIAPSGTSEVLAAGGAAAPAAAFLLGGMSASMRCRTALFQLTAIICECARRHALHGWSLEV